MSILALMIVDLSIAKHQEIVYLGVFFLQDEEDLIFCRLDRVLVNVEWLKVFQASNTCYISSGISDHAIKFSLSYSLKKGIKVFSVL